MTSRLFAGSALLVLAAFCTFILSGCDMTDGRSMLSDGNTSPAPTNSMPFSSLFPDTTSSAAPTASDDSMISDIEQLGEGIKDFAEGAVVDIANVPDIVKAVTDKYDDATVTGITHAMHLDKQVYKVTYTDSNGVSHTVYVSPDGKDITEAVEPEMSASPEETATSTASPSPSPSESPAEEG